MSEQANPYQPPQSETTAARTDSDGNGLWQDGDKLVMRKGARLPNVCVKSGKATTEPGIVRRFSWVPRWIPFTMLLGGPIAVAMFALFLHQKCKLDIPLSTDERLKRRRGKLLARSIIAATILYFIFVSLFIRYPIRPADDWIPFAFAAGLLPFAIGVYFEVKHDKVVQITRISKTHIWVKGVHASILASLPAFETSEEQSQPLR